MENFSNNNNLSNDSSKKTLNNQETNFEGALAFISQTIQETDTPMSKDLKRKAKLLIQSQEKAQENMSTMNSYTNYILLASDILSFCRESCDPLQNIDYNSCSKNCTLKYLEQLKLFNDNKDALVEKNKLNSIYFFSQDNLKAIKKFEIGFSNL